MPSKVGQRIRSARRAKGLTQVLLARQLGTTQATVCRWEKGTHEPSEPLRGALVDALEVELA